MPGVRIGGWKKGCNTVVAIKEIREKAGLPLNEALAFVNRVLANEQITVAVPTVTAAQSLVDSLERAGLIANTVDDMN
jgi:ribosomal protein L7/L12